MNVEQVNVGRSQPFQGILNGKVHRLGAIPTIHDLLLDGWIILPWVARILHD